jgi:EamA-like transporter family.
MRTAFIKLHISIVLAGFTGVLGKLILLPEVPLVWYRMLMTSVLFLGFLTFTGALRRIAPREALKIAGVGVLLTLHWIFFYGSIKYANVSVGVVCFALTGFFTALFEPLVFRRRISLQEVSFSLLTLLGIALIFHFDTRFRTGIILGVISAALCASFTIGNKIVGKRHDSQTLLLWQMLGGFAFISMALPVFLHAFPGAAAVPTLRDLFYLFILASLCTIGMYLLQLQALEKISAFTVNLSYNLEPVYSIAIAMLFLGEAGELGLSFYAGLTLICASVVLQTVAALRQKPAFL